MTEDLKRLADNLSRLPARDQDFARSLVQQGTNGRRPLSEKQLRWVKTLADRATGTEATPNLGDFRGVLALFDAARAHLKHPKIRLQLPDGTPLVLSVAGAASKMTGTVNVTDGGRFGANVWYGRVTGRGDWQPSSHGLNRNDVTATLRALARDPAGTAAAYGRMTGACCFCGLTLTDARSTEVGYGPVCAKHYNLPWGATAEEPEAPAPAAALPAPASGTLTALAAGFGA